MHQKTRYNIRLAEKHNVKIIHSTNVDDIDIFYNLAITTAARDNFSYHPREYYKKMLEILGPSKMLELYIAYTSTPLHHKPFSVAAILVLFYKDTAIYLHGASDHSYRQLMAPYLLQWQAIKDAKNRGCKLYDLQLTTYDSSHPWAGVTRFKTGFAPNQAVIHYPDCYDLVYKPAFYLIYNLVNYFRKL